MKCLGGHRAIWGGLLAVTVGFAATAASAAGKGERVRAASEAVQEALRSEIAGTEADRSELLRLALEQVSNYPPALWQTGHVQYRNKWVKHDELPDLIAEDRRLVEYRHRRGKAANTVDGQLVLAKWCVEHKLTELARAHLTALLEISPDHAEARGLLGHRRVDGAWLSEQETREAHVRAQQTAVALGSWRPELEQIRQKLEHRSERQRELATERLLAIDEVAAIPAMEVVLSTYSEEAALLVVRVLDKIDLPEAAGALARQAVFSKWERVREAAAEGLKSREPAAFVPMLLSATSVPIQSRAGLYRAPSGRLTYRHMLYREGQEEAQLAVFETEYPLALLSAFDPASWNARREELDRARFADASMKAQALQMSVAQRNAFIEALNERICSVLAKATGEKLTASPELWWKWWNDYNEVYTVGQKPLERVYSRDVVRFDDPYADVPVDVPVGTDEPKPQPIDPASSRVQFRQGVGRTVHGRRTPPLGDCLLAGTRVWTASGPTRIEEIQVGDLVLSQHPETGELAYKPVLKTTVRPPERLVKVVFGDKALQSSGGHPFWIVGRGWVKVRDIEPGSRLHVVEGTTDVVSVHATGREQTHNVIVADFHTYFVTEAKILTHDNTIREPTRCAVPGLMGRSPSPDDSGRPDR
jgi:hypothetical protein